MDSKDYVSKIAKALSIALDGYHNDRARITELEDEVNRLLDTLNDKKVPIILAQKRKDKAWIWCMQPTSNCSSLKIKKIRDRLRKALKRYFKHSEIYSEEDALLFRKLATEINKIKPGFYIHRLGPAKKTRHEDNFIFYHIYSNKEEAEADAKKRKEELKKKMKNGENSDDEGEYDEEDYDEDDVPYRTTEDIFVYGGEDDEYEYNSETDSDYNSDEKSESDGKDHSDKEEDIPEENIDVKIKKKDLAMNGYTNHKRKNDSDEEEDKKEKKKKKKKEKEVEEKYEDNGEEKDEDEKTKEKDDESEQESSSDKEKKKNSIFSI